MPPRTGFKHPRRKLGRVWSKVRLCCERAGDVYQTAISARGIPGYWFPKVDLYSESFAFDFLHNADTAGVPADGADADRAVIQSSGEGVITILNVIGCVIRNRRGFT
ncbi:hypothetical protein CUJ84_pRLN2000313 (plasmid) [Rhizobium leguminosarum]|uniref:Uncharacterized protein n=1 Tax=Rhizobium leguminosarum TaxID=384 RepID=A0A2K9ZF26_RHILE|nr:hypothetical protein CUJ84_pRLN2000313 [Rhizobium leguminosarum]